MLDAIENHKRFMTTMNAFCTVKDIITDTYSSFTDVYGIALMDSGNTHGPETREVTEAIQKGRLDLSVHIAQDAFNALVNALENVIETTENPIDIFVGTSMMSRIDAMHHDFHSIFTTTN